MNKKINFRSKIGLYSFLNKCLFHLMLHTQIYCELCASFDKTKQKIMQLDQHNQLLVSHDNVSKFPNKVVFNYITQITDDLSAQGSLSCLLQS